MEYEVLDTDEAPMKDLSEVEGIPVDLDICRSYWNTPQRPYYACSPLSKSEVEVFLPPV